MSEPEPPAGDVDVEETPQAEPAAEGYAPSVAARLAMYQRAGGIITPLVTALFAFLVGGLVVLATTGKNPLSTYRAIFNGTGLNWLFPWVSGAERHHAALNLQQTLIVMVPLILTSLAVAFAFRCGLFNIGGQGQYTVGTVAAVQAGIWFASMPRAAHILVAVVFAALAGAAWAGIAGLLRATVGAHEVITTIMLNWIALWVASYLVGFGGPLQEKSFGAVNPNTPDIANSAKLPVFWGDPQLQGLHIGDGGNRVHIEAHDSLWSVYMWTGWGDCPAGCINRHFWQFKYHRPTGGVETVVDSGPPVPSVRDER